MREEVGYLTYPNPQLATSLLGYEDVKVLAGKRLGADDSTPGEDVRPSSKSTWTVLHDAGYHLKVRSVRHPGDWGADPNRRNGEYGATPLGWCRCRRDELAVFGDHRTAAHGQMEAVLWPPTVDS